MLEFGASRNLMPKVIIDQLQLQITRPYHGLYTLDSKKVPYWRLIKDLVAKLAQIPVKSIIFNIVVTDIPPKFGMLLLRSCCARLGGSLQIDISYATIPVYGGEHLRLYREVRFINTVCKANQGINHPTYAIDQDFGCFTLAANELPNPQISIEETMNTLILQTLTFGKCILMGHF